MNPSLLNLFRLNLSLLKFITVARAPRVVAAHDWSSYFFFLNQKEKEKKN